MKAILKQAARALGYQIGPVGRWSNTVADYYPVFPESRWGHGKAPHPQILAALERGRDRYESTLRDLQRHKEVLWGIRLERGEPNAPFWDNEWFQSFDAACLVGFLLSRTPKRYLEIGSGCSTTFARHALPGLHITSIDPQPRTGIDTLCDRVLRRPLEKCDLSVFDDLGRGDILFFDGSHRVFPNSDVMVFFLEVIPRLKPGVLVHIHDIFLPADYPPDWGARLYSEQYLLGAMLLGVPPFEVILPNHFICTDAALSKGVREIFQAADGSLMPGALYRGAKDIAGSSFWVETTIET